MSFSWKQNILVFIFHRPLLRRDKNDVLRLFRHFSAKTAQNWNEMRFNFPLTNNAP